MKKAMKLAALLICTVATLALTGCGKDTEDLVVGTWIVDRMTDTEEVNGVEMGTEEMDFWKNVELKADGTFAITVNEDWKNEETYTGTWQLMDDGAKLVLTYMGISMNCTIDELSKSTFNIWWTESYSFDDETFVDYYRVYMSR